MSTYKHLAIDGQKQAVKIYSVLCLALPAFFSVLHRPIHAHRLACFNRFDAC